MKKELDYKKINHVLNLSGRILKILYFVMIIGILLLVTVLLKELKIIPFLLNILSIISPVIIGIGLSWLLNPLVKYFETKGLKRIYGTVLVYFLVILFIIVFFLMLVPTLMEQIEDLTKIIPDIIAKSNIIIYQIIDKLKNIDGLDISNIEREVPNVINAIGNNFVIDLPKNFISLVSGLFSFLGQFLLGLLVGFYFLLNYDNNKKHLSKLIPKKYKNEVDSLIKVISNKMHSFVKGTLISTLVLFIMCLVGFLIAGLKAPILFALFCSIINVIPYIGSLFGGIPTVIIALTQGVNVGILVLIIFIIIQVAYGNFILPYIMKKTMKLDQVTMIIGLIVFGYYYGMLGMLLATPIISILIILVKYILKKLKIFDMDDYDLESELQ